MAAHSRRTQKGGDLFGGHGVLRGDFGDHGVRAAPARPKLGLGDAVSLANAKEQALGGRPPSLFDVGQVVRVRY